MEGESLQKPNYLVFGPKHIHTNTHTHVHNIYLCKYCVTVSVCFNQNLTKIISKEISSLFILVTIFNNSVKEDLDVRNFNSLLRTTVRKSTIGVCVTRDNVLKSVVTKNFPPSKVGKVVYEKK